MAQPRPLSRVRSLLQGPNPVLPRPVDAASEWWSALTPRVRVAVAVIAVLAVGTGMHLRVQAAEQRWGGAPVHVLVATEDLTVGDPLTGVRRVALPPGAVPPTALTDLPDDDRTLTLGLPEGAVLTAAHVDARGPAASLDPSLRAVPVPVEHGWLVTAGGFVDVWVLGAGEEAATLVARSRPVLEVREEGSSSTALVALAVDTEVQPATAGLSLGRLLLAHAPAPTADARSDERSATD